MELDSILKTAHIHVEHTVYRIHVPDSDFVDLKRMQGDEKKPSFVNCIYRSNDAAQNGTSFLLDTCGEVDLDELADWVNSYL